MYPVPFDVQVSPLLDARGWVVAVSGEVEMTSAPALSAAVVELPLDRGTFVVLDLSSCTFIDSSGLRALVHSQRSVHARGGDLLVVSGGAHVEKVLEIVGFNRVLDIYASLADAVTRIAERGGADPA